jgi:membrane protein
MINFKMLKFLPRRVYHIAHAVVNGFLKDNCYLYAASLTFYSLLSIIPLLAIAFGLGKSFGFEYYLEKQLLNTFPQYGDWINQIIDITYHLLENTKGGLIASVGGITLIWTMLKLLENVEYALNNIWKVKYLRPYSRRFSDYMAMMFFAFFFFAASNGFVIYIITYFLKARETHAYLQTLTPLVLISLFIFPFFLSWVLFSFLYFFMPNTKVNLKYAIIAGFLASISYHLLQWIYIHFQIGVGSYGAIYGSFAAIPLFLVWLNMSWIVVLGGAEIAYNGESSQYVFSDKHEKVSISKQELALLITQHCVEAFCNGRGPVDIFEISKTLGISPSTSRIITNSLVDGSVLIESKESVGFLPARDVRDITLKFVLDGFEIGTQEQYNVNHSERLETLQKCLNVYNKSESTSSSNISLATTI